MSKEKEQEQKQMFLFYILAIRRCLELISWSSEMLLSDRKNCKQELRFVMKHIRNWVDGFMRRMNKVMNQKDINKIEDSTEFLFDGLMMLNLVHKKHRKQFLEDMSQSISKFVESEEKAKA